MCIRDSINAVAKVCEKTGADVELVAEGIGMDKRISRHFLNAGLGYGCLLYTSRCV